MDKFPYELGWNGVALAGPVIAFDTETTVVNLQKEIPQLVILTVTDGERVVVIPPHQVLPFVMLNAHKVWTGFNVRFDWWVIQKELENYPEVGKMGQQQWRELAASNRLHDAMLLDFLVRLTDTKNQGVLRNLDLGTVAKNRTGVRLDKNDPYRMRFGELLQVPWEDWRLPAFKPWFDYAVPDVIATYHTWKELEYDLQRAGRKENEHGFLTESLQVRASIVLSAITRNGVRIDRDRLASVAERLRGEIAVQVSLLQEQAPDLFSVHTTKQKRGQLVIRSKTGTPSVAQEQLRRYLAIVAAGEGYDDSQLPRTGKTRELSTAVDFWASNFPDHPFVTAWSTMIELNKTLQFVAKLETDNAGHEIETIHSDYTTLVRTGRTSSQRPNIQQMPREAWFREMFVPRPGHKFIIADYSAIELVTLAAVLVDRYGQSTLADVLRSGRKPHDYTAALISGWSYEEQLEGVKREKAAGIVGPFSNARQGAKALNFGLPGGLGAERLSRYAKVNYGVHLSKADAGRFRQLIITEVYPELSLYLDDAPATRLAEKLGVSVSEVLEEFGPKDQWFWRQVEMVLSGAIKPYGRRGRDLFAIKVWEGLNRLNRNPKLWREVSSYHGSDYIFRTLMGEDVTTLTGRVRAGAKYSEARNTAFQGLAADGAKVALWELWKAGYNIVAFIHDEVVVEVEDELAEGGAAEEVAAIMKTAMASVLGADIPVEVEAHVSDRWSK